MNITHNMNRDVFAVLLCVRALTVVFSRQCSRWWCWLSNREVDLLSRCSSSMELCDTHTHARTQTQRMRALHFPSQRHRRDVGGVRPAAASVPDLKGSSCTEVASVGEGDKSKTDKVVLLAFMGRH